MLESVMNPLLCKEGLGEVEALSLGQICLMPILMSLGRRCVSTPPLSSPYKGEESGIYNHSKIVNNYP